MKRIVAYTLAEFLSKMALFLVFPIAKIFLSEDDFGYFSLIFPFLQNFQIVCALGLTTSISVFYFNPHFLRHKIVFNAFFVWSIAILLMCATMYFVVDIYLTEYIKWYFPCMFFLLSGSFLMMIAQVFQLEKRTLSFIMASNAPKITIPLVITGLYFLYAHNILLDNMLMCMALANTIFMFVFVPKIIKDIISLDIDMNLIYEMLKIGLPTMLTGVIVYFAVSGGRLVLLEIATLKDIGDLAIIQTIAGITSLFFAVLSRIVSVENYKRVANNNITIEYMTFLFSKLSICLSLFIFIVALISRYILIYMNSVELLDYVYILLFGSYFQIHYAIFIDIAYAKKNIKNIIYANIISVIFNIVFTFFAFNQIGLVGVVIVQIATNILLSVLIVLAAKESFKTYMLIPFGKIFLFFLFGFTFVVYLNYSSIMFYLMFLIVFIMLVLFFIVNRKKIRIIFGS